MDKLREAAQQALEALEVVTRHFTRTPSTLKDSETRGEAHKIIASLRTALAEQQEPVAWLHWLHGPVRLFMNKDEAMMELERLNREYPVDSNARQMKPLYTAPQPRREVAQEPCKWQLDDEESGTWESGCGELWSFIDGGPVENRVRFCHGCGKPVEVKT